MSDLPDMTNISNYPVLVLSTSKEAGEKYAEVLRLDNYRICTKLLDTQGIRYRGVIVSPAYLARVVQTFDQTLDAFWASEQSQQYEQERG